MARIILILLVAAAVAVGFFAWRTHGGPPEASVSSYMLAADRFVDVAGAHGGIGEHGYYLRLHLEDATGNIEALFLAIFHDHAHLAGFEPGDQRGVPGRDTKLAHDARGDDQLHRALKDFGLGAYDVTANGAHGDSGVRC